mmetsp:Transcript_61578/g.179960  ORF Transcript_61578/g.179960 Transcript_61578/m.179960 type:complete len:438 (-) Transcript_61578:240-1553(-)
MCLGSAAHIPASTLRISGCAVEVPSSRHVNLAPVLPPVRGTPSVWLRASHLVYGGALTLASVRHGMRWRWRRTCARATLTVGRELPAEGSLEGTLQCTFAAGVQALSDGSAQPIDTSAPTWTIEADEEVAGGAAYYTRFCIDPLPAGQGRQVGNLLRRTLLRHDFFESHAMVALRVQHRPFQANGVLSPAQRAKHEFSSVAGVKESMIDVIHNVQNFAIARDPARDPAPQEQDSPLAATDSEEGDEVETWRWTSRHCGPCAVQARDLEIVDSSTHFEIPLRLAEDQHHLCQLTAPSMLELEMEAVCCSEDEWDKSPAFQKYRKRLLQDGWLMVPPLFSPVKKVNYTVTRSSKAPEAKEAVQLEVWTRVSVKPTTLVSLTAASLYEAIALQGTGSDDDAAGAADPSADVDSGEGAGLDSWDDVFKDLNLPEADDSAAR